MQKCLTAVFAALLILPLFVSAQTTAPATEHVRRPVIVPPGFQEFTVNGFTAIANARDSAWLHHALSKLGPTTLPVPMPGDLAARLKTERSAFIARMTKDLALPDDKLATDTIDNVIAREQKLADLKPPMIYFVATLADVKSLLKNGWEDPRFYYNKAADNVEMHGKIVLDIDHPMDDQLYPLIISEDDSDATREKKFLDGMPGIQATTNNQVAGEGKIMFYGGFAQPIADKVFTPLNLPRDQEWFAQGVTNYLPFRYLADLGGGDFDELFKNFSHVPSEYPLQPSSIDLTHPLKVESLRPDAVNVYDNVLRAKSGMVVAAWAKEAGQDSIGKVMAALRAGLPANGDALVQLIKDKTYIDLGRALKE